MQLVLNPKKYEMVMSIAAPFTYIARTCIIEDFSPKEEYSMKIPQKTVVTTVISNNWELFQMLTEPVRTCPAKGAGLQHLAVHCD